MEGDDVIGLDGGVGQCTSLRIQPRGNVHRYHMCVAVVQLRGRRRHRFAQVAADPRADHCVDEQVRITEIDGRRIAHLFGRDLGLAERRPVLPGDICRDRLRATEQQDPDVEVLQKPRCDEGVPAVVAPPRNDRDLVDGVGVGPDCACDGVASGLHQLLARDAERRRVRVDHRHLVARDDLAETHVECFDGAGQKLGG